MSGIVPAVVFAALVGTVTVLLARFTTAKGAMQLASEVTEAQKSARSFALFVAIIATLTGAAVVYFLFPQKQAGAVALGIISVVMIAVLSFVIHATMAPRPPRN